MCRYKIYPSGTNTYDTAIIFAWLPLWSSFLLYFVCVLVTLHVHNYGNNTNLFQICGQCSLRLSGLGLIIAWDGWLSLGPRDPWIWSNYVLLKSSNLCIPPGSIFRGQRPLRRVKLPTGICHHVWGSCGAIQVRHCRLQMDIDCSKSWRRNSSQLTS